MPVIVSIHISKTAGMSFGQALRASLKDRLLSDYGDWAGFNSPEAIAHRAARAIAMRTRRDELLRQFDAIHGHFHANKYLDLFPQTDFVAFFRDPYQQAVSNYCFLRSNPQFAEQHPAVKTFHEEKMTIFDYLNWEYARNPQTTFLAGVPVESFAMVGLSEEFERSVAFFNLRFGLDLSSEFAININPERQGRSYEIDHDVRKAVDRSRGADLDLYRRAREIFAKQIRRLGPSVPCCEPLEGLY